MKTSRRKKLRDDKWDELCDRAANTVSRAYYLGYDSMDLRLSYECPYIMKVSFQDGDWDASGDQVEYRKWNMAHLANELLSGFDEGPDQCQKWAILFETISKRFKKKAAQLR